MDTKKLRQKILDLAIRGKLVPQDTNDEPASVLLEHIRAEKERLIKEGKIKRSKKTESAASEIEAPFKIPESWEWCKLEDVLLLLSGQDFPPSKYNSESRGVPYIIGASNIENEKLLVNRWTETPSVVSKLNDVLVVCKGAGVGKIAMNDVGDVHIARQIQAVRDETGIINSKYIKICIASNISSIIANANGLIPGLKRELLLSLMVPIAPIEEQERIVTFVERWHSFLDKLESNEGDLLKAIDQAKSKILDLAIHGKLVPQDPNDEPAIDLLKRINPKFTLCDEDNEQIPTGWVNVAIKDCKIDILNGFAFQSSKYVNSGIRIIRITNVQDGYIEDETPKYYPIDYEEELEKYVLKADDLLMSLTGNVGRVGFLPKSLLPAALNQRVGCIRISDQSISNKFLFYLFLTERFKKDCIASGKGVAQLNISTEWLKSYIIPLPPSQEQLRIVAKIEELFAVLDSIKETLK